MKIKVLLSIILLASIIASTVIALSISNMSITPVGINRPTVEDDLTCSWTPSADVYSQNITWINGSTIYSGPTPLSNTTNQSVLTAGIARKGEIWKCNITAYNGSTTTTNSLSVTIKNALPTTPNASDTALFEDQTYTTTISSTDPDEEDNIEYSLKGGLPSYCSLGLNSGILTCNPDASNIGISNVTFYADDGGNYTAKTSVIFNVSEVNDQPEFVPALSNQNATEGTLFNYSIIVDDEEDHMPITFSMNSNLTNISITPYGDDRAYITFTHPGNAPDHMDYGYYYVTVNITDIGSDNSTPYDNPHNSATFYLTVNTINQAPNITSNLSGINGTQGSLLTFTVDALDNDIDDTLSFGISSSCDIADVWNISTINSSYQGQGLVNLTLTNDHIICQEINITVTDGAATDWESVTLNLTNTNDAPTVYEMSYYPDNTDNNMSNIVAVKGREVVFYINATDPDSDTYEGETLSYSDNTSVFNVNASGAIAFTPDASDVGIHQVLINVSDDEGLWDSRILIMNISNNTAPVLQTINLISCAEDSLCSHTFTATDPDPGEVLTFSTNSSLFNLSTINATAVQMSFTPTNAQVGDYSINLSVEDHFGFSDEEIFVLEINNTNDNPFFDQNNDGIPDTVMFDVAVEEYTSSYRINVTDDDLLIGMDNLSYGWSFISSTGNLEQNFTINNSGSSFFVVIFTPNSSQVGLQEVNLTVNDSNGGSYWQNVSFTVLAKSQKPIIDMIRPHLNGSITSIAFGNASVVASNTSSVSFNENTSVIFDALARNDSAIPNNDLTYYWYVDNVLQSTRSKIEPGVNSSYTHMFDFFDAGSHTVRLVAEDDRYSSRQWMWSVEINDVNRPPQILGQLTNISFNSSLTISDYFSYRNGYQRFYDPDEDLNSDSLRGETFGEETNLTYSLAPSYTCDEATFGFSDDDITLTPVAVGTCLVEFRATDPDGEYVDSNIVWVTVTDVIVEEVEVETSSGGSSNTRPRVVPIPIEEPIETPVPFDLIVPEEAQTYENQTVEVPIILNNTWNETLQGIYVNATSSNQTDSHSIWLSSDYVDQLKTGEDVEITLFIENYRIDSPFTVTVDAYVEDPDFHDSAVIMINAMEKTDSGEDVISKVTFARDLLNDNPECQELNELLEKAEENRQSGNLDQAVKLVNTVVNGCKYLINNKVEPESENPKLFFTISSYISRNLPATIILGSIIAILVGFGIAMLVTARNKGEEL